MNCGSRFGWRRDGGRRDIMTVNDARSGADSKKQCDEQRYAGRKVLTIGCPFTVTDNRTSY
jgi:hypothetical protein